MLSAILSNLVPRARVTANLVHSALFLLATLEGYLNSTTANMTTTLAATRTCGGETQTKTIDPQSSSISFVVSLFLVGIITLSLTVGVSTISWGRSPAGPRKYGRLHREENEQPEPKGPPDAGNNNAEDGDANNGDGGDEPETDDNGTGNIADGDLNADGIQVAQAPEPEDPAPPPAGVDEDDDDDLADTGEYYLEWVLLLLFLWFAAELGNFIKTKGNHVSDSAIIPGLLESKAHTAEDGLAVPNLTGAPGHPESPTHIQEPVGLIASFAHRWPATTPIFTGSANRTVFSGPVYSAGLRRARTSRRWPNTLALLLVFPVVLFLGCLVLIWFSAHRRSTPAPALVPQVLPVAVPAIQVQQYPPPAPPPPLLPLAVPPLRFRIDDTLWDTKKRETLFESAFGRFPPPPPAPPSIPTAVLFARIHAAAQERHIRREQEAANPRPALDPALQDMRAKVVVQLVGATQARGGSAKNESSDSERTHRARIREMQRRIFRRILELKMEEGAGIDGGQAPGTVA